MFFRILKKDLKRKKVMNAILLCFILLATMFVASGISSNVVSVMNGTDSYLDKAGIGDYVVISMGADSKASIDEILHEMESIRGNHVSMIFQDPMSSLNPLIPVGKQVAEMLKEHHKEMGKEELKKELERLIAQKNMLIESQEEI